jgi:hypothetical protein
METPEEERYTSTYEYGGACSSCSWVLPPLVITAPHYFENGHVLCEHCGQKVNLWEMVLARTRAMSIQGSFSSWALISLGAGNTSMVRPLTTGSYHEFDLEEYGVPAGARILGVNITGQGGEQGAVSALSWHTNTVTRRMQGTKLRLLGVALGEGPTPRTGNVAISAIWIRKEESDGWLYLLSAFEAAVDGDFAPSLVFAQSAIEITMMPLIATKLRLFASGDNVKGFLRATGFDHALNVILPYVGGQSGIPMLPENIRGALNSLNRKRNRIIHEGASASKINAEDLAEGLTAAVMGFEYLRYIDAKLLPTS